MFGQNRSDRKFMQLLEPVISAIMNDPYKNLTVNVRESSNLCSQEQGFLTQRHHHVKKSIENILGHSIKNEHVPKIGICGSGGGYRALVAMFGSISGFEQTGLLDCVTYASGLSGATWMLGTWYAHQGNLPLLKIILKSELQNSLLSDLEITAIIKDGFIKFLYGQKLSLVGLFGNMAANRLFGDFGREAYNLKFSDISEMIRYGKMPMPIMTAITVEGGYSWLEFTPFEVGSDQLEFHIPTWSLGRRFEGGLSTNRTPENSLGYIMGLCGSAFTISLSEAMEGYSRFFPSIIYETLDTVSGFTEIGHSRISPGIISNPQYKNAQRPLNHFPDLPAVDGGFYFNIPLPALLKKERQVDMIIVLDHSSDIENAQELRKAARYAKKHGYRWPKINYRNLHTKAVTVFVDPDPSIPMLLYIPLLKNPAYSEFDPIACLHEGGYCHTFNLYYTPEQVTQLCDLTEFTIKEHKAEFVDAIEMAVERKKRQTLIKPPLTFFTYSSHD